MNSSKKIIVGVIILILTASVVYLVSPTLQKKLSALVKSAQESKIGEELFTTPLKGTTDAKDAALTKAGVITHTNKERQNNGFVALTENDRLDVAAELKLKDMFDKQHFVVLYLCE